MGLGFANGWNDIIAGCWLDRERERGERVLAGVDDEQHGVEWWSVEREICEQRAELGIGTWQAVRLLRMGPAGCSQCENCFFFFLLCHTV